jgi:hypothetical protein
MPIIDPVERSLFRLALRAFLLIEVAKAGCGVPLHGARNRADSPLKFLITGCKAPKATGFMQDHPLVGLCWGIIACRGNGQTLAV